MNYPKITLDQVTQKDFTGNGNDVLALDTLRNLSFNVTTPEVTGGAANSTVSEYVFVAPTKMEVTGAKFIISQVNVGASNTPTVSVKNGANVVASKDIQLGGSAGNVAKLDLTAANVVANEGDVLTCNIVTPSAATVTTALKGKFQIEWKSVV